MSNETKKKFFDAFGIERKILQHQQFYYAQVPRGLEIFKTREELANTGMIKISYKKLTPTPENYCIYWGEYHYPTITDRILLELIVILNPYAPAVGATVEELKNQVLYWCVQFKTEVYHQVRALFGEGEGE